MLRNLQSLHLVAKLDGLAPRKGVAMDEPIKFTLSLPAVPKGMPAGKLENGSWQPIANTELTDDANQVTQTRDGAIEIYPGSANDTLVTLHADHGEDESGCVVTVEDFLTAEPESYIGPNSVAGKFVIPCRSVSSQDAAIFASNLSRLINELGANCRVQFIKLTRQYLQGTNAAFRNAIYYEIKNVGWDASTAHEPEWEVTFRRFRVHYAEPLWLDAQDLKEWRANIASEIE